MIVRFLISMFIINILTITSAKGSKAVLSTQRLYTPYCNAVKATNRTQSPNKVSWKNPHENLMNYICLVMKQKNRCIHPDNEMQLIKKLMRKIQRELFIDDVRMFDLSIKKTPKPLSNYSKDCDQKELESDWLVRNKSLIKGYLGELDANNLMLYSGYKILPCRLPNNQGIDHVFIKYARKGGVEDIVIMESKYIYTGGRVKLAKSSKKIQQLSSVWLNKQIENLRMSELHPRTLRALEKNRDKIQLQGFFTYSDGQRRWGDYGRFDYKNPISKIAKRVASCCPYPMSKGLINRAINTTKSTIRVRRKPKHENRTINRKLPRIKSAPK